MPDLDRSPGALSLSLGALGLLAIVWAVVMGRDVRRDPDRCAPGLIALGPRCCAPGQGLSEGKCVGQPLSCPAGARLLRGNQPGCVFATNKVLIPSGSVLIGPTDWDSVSVVTKREIAVRSFYLDDAEVQVSRYLACAERKACEELARAEDLEPGVPVTELSAEAAERFCRSEGGRLPSAAEWLFAAAGREARRFPWGPHGLVCRRASYGLSTGPCAEGGRGPELTKARPSGQTPEGIFDLVGNVAEWTKNPDGQVSIHGGSFASTVASELKSWSETLNRPGPEVGFRCAYDLIQNP